MSRTLRRPGGMTATAALMALLLALAMLVPPQPGAQAEEPTTITILHDSHFHGNFEDTDSDIARYFALVEQRKAEKEHALFLGNGDDIAPSLLSGVFRGDHMIDALNAAPIDYNTFGNHEFDYGPDKLLELVEATESFTWVSANVRSTETDDVFAEELGAKLFDIREIDGVNVGITGLGPRDMATITSMGDDAYEVPYLDAMEEVVPLMQDAGADIIVVSSHLCNDDAIVLAEEVDGIDLIVGDHCATATDEPLEINDTIVNFAGDQFEFLDEIDLHVVDGELTGFGHTRHVLSDIAPEPHPDIQAIVEHYNDQLDDELNVVIGERAVDWDARIPIVRFRETAVGNYLTDIYAEGLDADIGMQNGGGIRGDRIYEAGDITRRDIVEMLPFDNYMVVKEIPGHRVLDLLDATLERGDGARMQLSGVEMVYDLSRPDGERVLRATMGCEPIDPDEVYTIATIDFLADGGSGLDDVLGDLPYVPGFGPHEGDLNSAYVIEYLEEVQDGPVTTDVEGRLHELDADFDQPDPLCGPLDEVSPYVAEFDEVPGNVNAGRTVPVRFQTLEDDEVVEVDGMTATVTTPDGDVDELRVRPHGSDRAKVLVRTDRDQRGDYEVEVFDGDGASMGSLTIETD
jgi:2',3'-cyclic-nucleotide 2'-phosphodiesterase (5'-nucleotidase family)